MAKSTVITGVRRFHFIFSFVIVGLLLTLGAEASAQATCMDNTSGPFGSLLSVEEFDSAVQALPAAAFLTPPVQPPLPSRAYLTNLPAVSQQGTTASPGSPGTCEAQSFGYGLGSYTAARRPDGSSKWPAALPQNSVSPAFLFAWALDNRLASCPRGGLALPYLDRLVALGAPTRARIPYQPDCTYFESTIPGQRDFPDSYPGMQRFRIGSYAAFNISTNPPAALQMIKEYIAHGQAVAFSGKVLCGYGRNLQLQDGVIYETSYIVNNDKPAGHGQLVVGYDDDIGTPGNQGALLIQNSFGTAWPASAGATSSPAPPGMVYWSYNSFEQTQMLAAVAYPRSPGPPAGVMLSGGRHAPLASITRAFQWVRDSNPSATYLILMHFFQEPMLLSEIVLTEPGGNNITATGAYGQAISTGYSYLVRKDGHAFLSGTWTVSLEGTDVSGNPVTYTGTVEVGTAQPNAPAEVSMAGQEITDSTGAIAPLTP